MAGKRWGFLGAGRVTPRMVDAIRSAGDEVVAVSSRDRSKAVEWASRFGVPLVMDRWQEVIDCDQVDCVYNALPPSMHAEWSIASLSAGKPVLCEKPLAIGYEQAHSILDASIRHGVSIDHATSFVHHPRSVAMRDLLNAGGVGEIKRITIACSFSHVLNRGVDHRTDASVGGGCLLDLGWYCVYATLWMLGAKPESMHVLASRIHPQDPSSPWCQVQVISRLDNGAIASWDCGYDAAGRKWMEIAGKDGSVICDDFLRPWDIDKPRFWIHGHDGKARCETVGAGIFQEVEMMKRWDPSLAEQASFESMKLAVETHSILERIEKLASDAG